MCTTWIDELLCAMDKNCESWLDLVECTLNEEELNTLFDNGHGLIKGKSFTVWTKDYVYFPVTYDGAEWVGSVPRNPNGQATIHVGGG